jgi:hypothetical protein
MFKIAYLSILNYSLFFSILNTDHAIRVGWEDSKQPTYLLLVFFAPFSPILQAPVHLLVSFVFFVQKV